MKGVYLFDNKYNLIDSLPPDQLTENYMDAELNGIITGTFTTTTIKNFDDFYYFGVKDEFNFWLYKIRSIVKETDVIRVHGIHIMYDELQGVVVRDIRPNNQLVSTVMGRVLADTDWTVGQVVVSSKFTGNFYYQSALSALYEVANRSTCEFFPKITFSKGKIVSKQIVMMDSISSDYGKLFKYGDNLIKVVAETNTDEIYTRFIGRGKGEEIFDASGQATGGFGRKIRFDTIDFRASQDGITVHSPIGQDYIEIKEATALYGYPSGKPREVVVDFDDVEDRQQLAQATFDYALQNCRPKVQLKASGLQFEAVELGETVTIIGQMDIRYKTRVFKIKKDFLQEKVVSFEFGDKVVKSMGDRIKQGQLAEKEREITEQNYIKAMISMVENSYFNEDGYQYDLKADNEYKLPAGFYSFNKPIDQNPDKVIYFGAGKLMISNGKNSDGSWDFSVAIDGDAVNANVIRAGILRGGRVYWDLQNGTFIIGDDDYLPGRDPNNYSMWWDGNTLHLRNVDIDLSNNYSYQQLVNKVDESKDFFISNVQRLTLAQHEALKKQNELVDSLLIDVRQDFKLGQGELESSIKGLRQDIFDDGGKLQTQLRQTYSTIEQTDQQIKTQVADRVERVNGELVKRVSTVEQTADGLSKTFQKFETNINNNYLTKTETETRITQSNQGLETSVKQINNKLFGGGVDKNGVYVSPTDSMESRIKQTASELSTKVSKGNIASEINQTPQGVKIKAEKIDLTGNLQLQGTFKSATSERFAILDDGNITMGSYGKANLLSYLGAVDLTSTISATSLWHDPYSALTIGYKNRDNQYVSPYIIFDKFFNMNKYTGEFTYPITVKEHTKFNGVAFFDYHPFFHKGVAINDWKLDYNTIDKSLEFKYSEAQKLRIKKDGSIQLTGGETEYTSVTGSVNLSGNLIISKNTLIDTLHVLGEDLEIGKNGIKMSKNDINLKQGSLRVTDGDISIVNGGITLTLGNLNVLGGDIMIDSSHVIRLGKLTLIPDLEGDQLIIGSTKYARKFYISFAMRSYGFID